LNALRQEPLKTVIRPKLLQGQLEIDWVNLHVMIPRGRWMLAEVKPYEPSSSVFSGTTR